MPFLTSQLYLILAPILGEGSAPFALVQNFYEETAVRGVLAWQAVLRDAIGMSWTRLQALATKVHSPDHVPKSSVFGVAIEQGSTWPREYEAACGNGGIHHRVPDVAKITAVRQLVPKELDLDIGRQANLKAFDEVRAYIAEEVVIRREPYFVGSKKAEQRGADVNSVHRQRAQYDTSGSVWWEDEWPSAESGTMDTEAFFAGQGQNGKGKGKSGKGQKANFFWTCHHCGQFGHHFNQCPAKDHEVKGKGKGKGGKGKAKGGYGKVGAGGSWGSPGGSPGGWGSPPGLGALAWMDRESCGEDRSQYTNSRPQLLLRERRGAAERR